jgi:hypothetical protein
MAKGESSGLAIGLPLIGGQRGDGEPLRGRIEYEF